MPRGGRSYGLLAAGVATAVAALALTGCTQDGAPAEKPTAKPAGKSAGNPAAPTASAVQTPGTPRLEDQVRDALGGPGGSADDPSLVAMGSERLADGAYTVTPLEQGASYRLQVVCVGGGPATVTAQGNGLPQFSAPCDGGSTTGRITSAPASFTLHIKPTGPAPGTPGMIGWRLTRVR